MRAVVTHAGESSRLSSGRWSSIGTKLALLIAALQILGVAFLGSYFEIAQQRTLSAGLSAKATSYGELVSTQVRSAVAFDDQETAREVFESLAKDVDVQGLALVKQSGQVLHSWGSLSDLAWKAKSGVAKLHVFDLSDRVLTTAPVVSLEGPRGTLILELSKRRLLLERSRGRNAALMAIGLALLVGVGTALLIARSLARRLRAIATVAGQVASGDLGQPAINDPAGDEIGSLTRSFNTMLEQLKALIAETQLRARQEQARLETLVSERTVELETRNDDMRRVLENVEQGFLTIDNNGEMSRERSAVVQRWLGPSPSSGLFWDYVEQASPGLGSYLEFAWQQVINGVLPRDVALDQMPRCFQLEERHFTIQFRPIAVGEEEFRRTLVVISDVTADHERARAEQDEQEATQLLSKILVDRAGVTEFLEETNAMIATLFADCDDSAQVKRLVHTLKGNCSIFGLHSIATLCHEIEEQLGEPAQLSVSDRTRLKDRWQHVSGKLSYLFGKKSDDGITIDDDEYRQILSAIALARPHHEISAMIEAWRLEPTAVRLNRAALHLDRLAKRLGKDDVEVRIESNSVRLDAAQWTDFWSAFQHVLRNAVDHGLETAAERAQAGKKEPPLVELRTALDDEYFVIEVADNGRGIDWDAVRSVAKKKGLPCATEHDVQAALLADGISTRETVSENSGRGIGMSALRAAVEARGGRVEVASKTGCGTRFRMLWPAELARGPLTPAQSSRRINLAVGLNLAHAY